MPNLSNIKEDLVKTLKTRMFQDDDDIMMNRQRYQDANQTISDVQHHIQWLMSPLEPTDQAHPINI